MIVERRAYTLRPGAGPDFWDLQVRYNQGGAMLGLLKHTICYFDTVAGVAEQIVHLHRFDSLGEWEDTYATLYRDHSPEYFARARELLLAQETVFFRPGPHETPALTEAERPVAPFTDDLLVVEERYDLLPGTAAKFWESFTAFTKQRSELAERGLLGGYASFTGPLHRVLQYRCYRDRQELTEHRALLDGSPEATEHHRRLALITRASGRTLLAPAPITSHRPLFAVAGAG